MPLTHTKVHSDAAPTPLPVFSQAIKCGEMIYVSGNIGNLPGTGKTQIVEGTVGDRARQALLNIKTVLEEAGSGLDKIVKVCSSQRGWNGRGEGLMLEEQANVYLTDMANFAVMNKAYKELVPGKEGAPMPARYVFSLPSIYKSTW